MIKIRKPNIKQYVTNRTSRLLLHRRIDLDLENQKILFGIIKNSCDLFLIAHHGFQSKTKNIFPQISGHCQSNIMYVLTKNRMSARVVCLLSGSR